MASDNTDIPKSDGYQIDDNSVRGIIFSCYMMSDADGNISAQETENILNIIQTNPLLNEYDKKKLQEIIEEYSNSFRNKKTYEKIMIIGTHLSNAENEVKRLFLDNLVEVSISDNHLHISEESLLLQMVKAVNIERDTVFAVMIKYLSRLCRDKKLTELQKDENLKK